MKNKLLLLFVFLFSLEASSKSVVIKTGYDSYTINDITHKLTYYSFINKKTTVYPIVETKVENDGSTLFIIENSGEYVLYQLYEANDKYYIVQYRQEITQKRTTLKLFDVGRGYVDFAKIKDYGLSQVNNYIENSGLSGESANAYRNEFGKYMDGIESGEITNFNYDGSFSITNQASHKYKNFGNYVPKIKKGSWVKGTNDEYIQDADYGRNQALNDLTSLFSQYGLYEESTEKEWVQKLKSEVKSIEVE